MIKFAAISVLIIQVLCVVFPIIQKQKDDTKFRHSLWDYLIILFSLIGFGFSIYILNYTDDEDLRLKKKEEDYRIELAQKLAERDSIKLRSDSLLTLYYIEKLDSSYTNSVKASNEALAKYNLVLIDSLRRVRDNINAKAKSRPFLTIPAIVKGESAPIYLDKDEMGDIINIKYESLNNVSFNIKVKYYLLKCKTENPRYTRIEKIIDSGFLFKERSSLSQERIATSSIFINEEIKKLNCVYIYLKGTYCSDEYCKETIDYEEALIFDVKNNKMLLYPIDKQDLIRIRALFFSKPSR